MKRRILYALLAASLIPFTAGSASATSLSVFVDATNTATVLVDNGLEIVIDASGDLVLDLQLVTTIPFSGIVLSASFPGLTGSGTGSPTGGNLLNFGDFTSLGALADPAAFSPANDLLVGWAWASPSGTVSPGTFDLGSLTLTVDQATTILSYGTNTPDDGFSDANQNIIVVPNAVVLVRIVPEPGSAALMMAAIGTVGFISRRARAA